MVKTTIADVARLAGVSKSTVSRVLSGSDTYMRADTRAHVLQAIATLNYQPSAVARSLVLKRTSTVALLVSDIGNPFYPEVMRGVEDVALKQGYNVFLGNTGYDLERAMALARSLAAKQVDGALLMSSSMSDELVRELAVQHVPVVVLDWQLQAVQGVVGLIEVDFAVGIQAAVDHLMALGHRRLAHVSGPLELRTARERLAAFQQALVVRHIDPDSAPVISGNLRIDGGRLALAELVSRQERPTGILAANDLTAMGLIWAAREQGLRVPADLSVIGLDNIQLAGEVVPPLTTVDLPRYEIGRLAMEMLLDLLGEQNEPQVIPLRRARVGTRLVVRGSTAQAPRE